MVVTRAIAHRQQGKQDQQMHCTNSTIHRPQCKEYLRYVSKLFWRTQQIGGALPRFEKDVNSQAMSSDLERYSNPIDFNDLTVLTIEDLHSKKASLFASLFLQQSKGRYPEKFFSYSFQLSQISFMPALGFLQPYSEMDQLKFYLFKLK